MGGGGRLKIEFLRHSSLYISIFCLHRFKRQTKILSKKMHLYTLKELLSSEKYKSQGFEQTESLKIKLPYILKIFSSLFLLPIRKISKFGFKKVNFYFLEELLHSWVLKFQIMVHISFKIHIIQINLIKKDLLFQI